MKRNLSVAILTFLIALSSTPAWSQLVTACGTTVPTTFEAFTYTPTQSWNTSAYKSMQYPAAGYMRFRLLVPNGFDCGNSTKYPLIVFLHGSGESAPCDCYNGAAVNDGLNEQNNDLHLVHGGQKHQTAVQNGTFPGFVLFPQNRKGSPTPGNPDGTGNYWGDTPRENVRQIIDKLIADYKVDPDRIYIHGLSMGGEGTWLFLKDHPQYFAAANPMSAAGSIFWSSGVLNNYIHVPLRHSQGGLDTNPPAVDGNNMVTEIRNAGGNEEYHYYPTLGHATWNSEYNRTDFFSWFLARKKYSIHVKYGQTSFCAGEAINVVLGLTPGFSSYNWYKDGALLPQHTNEITVTSAGSYRVEFQRSNGVWTPLSDPVVIDNNRAPSPTPTITTNTQSVNLPPLDGSPDVTLIGTANKTDYSWKRDAVAAGTTSTITVNTAGSYTLTTRDPAETGLTADGVPTQFRAITKGCESLPSTPVVVTTTNSPGTPSPPGNFYATASSPSSVSLGWDDRSSNELGFEIYRTTTSGSSYKLISIRPATTGPNPQTFVDNVGILPNTKYYYVMRAVNDKGGSAYTPEISVFTATDNVAPVAPVLSLVSTTRSEINLSWTGASDNVAVYEYDVYQNNLLIATVPASQTTYKATGLVALANYNYFVKARDYAGNASVPSNIIVASAVNTGLAYSYYEFETTITSVTQITTNGTLVKTGYVANFSSSPKNRSDLIGIIYDGFITIPTTGSYTFYLTSDDGSQLYVNNVLVVNHNGTHGCTEKTGTPISLSAGNYPIKGYYFNNAGGNCFSAKWQGPGITKAAIPDQYLRDNATLPTALNAPSALKLTPPAPTPTTITVSWTDNSGSNETGFEIQRSINNGNNYQSVFVTAANATSWVSTGLTPNTTYFFRVRAVNTTTGAVSPYTSGVNIKTAVCTGCTPNVPTNLAGVANSATLVTLTWTDNSANETGFELQKSTSPTTGFVTFATTAAGITTARDSSATGHSTIYYKIRALGAAGNNSAYSAAVSVNTPNRAPTIQDIPNQTLTAGQATPQVITIKVTDPDNDPISFNVTGLPAGGIFTDDGYGMGTLTFTNVALSTVANITVQGSDGLANASDAFTITFTANRNPAAVVTNPNPFNGTLITEEGRTTSIVFTVTDADANTQLTAAFPPTVANLPSFAAAPVWTVPANSNARTYTINFTPALGKAGVYNDIAVTFRDNQGGSTVYTFSVIVAPVDKYFTISMNFVSSATNIPNYTPANWYEASPWNNTGSPSTQDIINLKDDTGTIVKFVTFNTGTGWTDSNPVTYPTALPLDPLAPYTKKVRESFFKRNTTSTATTVTFKNLNPSLKYKVTVFGSGPTASGTIPTKYVVTGASAQTLLLNTLNNTSQTATTPNAVYPTGTNTFTIAVSPNTGSSTYFINALVLTAQYPSTTPPVAPSGLTLSAPAYNQVIVSWTDNSNDETSFNILRSNTLNGTYSNVGSVGPNITTFTDNTVSGRTTYYYKVEADNGNPPASATPALVITTPNGAPIVDSVYTQTVRAGQIIQFDISASDPEDDIITFSTLSLPAFATLVDNGNGTGYIRLQPQASDIGTYNYKLQATDNFSAKTEKAATIIVLDEEVDETIYINFKSTANPAAGAPWNNKDVTSSDASLNNLTGPSGISMTKSGTWLGSTASGVTSGVNTGNNSGYFPDLVTRSYWSNATSGTITFSGLDPAMRYNFTIFGSRNEWFFENTVYTVNGIVSMGSKTLNATKNKDKVARFVGIQPTNLGIITLTVAKGPNPDGTNPLTVNRDAVINGMLIEGYTPGNTPRKPTALKAEGISRTDVKLTWNDNSSDETQFEIFRATTQGGPFTSIATVGQNIETYTDNGLTANTAYIYHVRALKSGGTPSAVTGDALATTFNQRILVNFNYAAHLQAPSPWNNTAAVPEAGVTFQDLKNDNGFQTTPVDFTIIEQGSGPGNNTGYMTGNNSGVYPDAVLSSYYFYEQFDSSLPQYLVSELDPNYEYDFVFFGDEWTAASINGVTVATDYSVGSDVVSLYNGKNATETVTIKGIKPDPDGTVLITVKTNDEAKYGVWNSLEIRSYTPVTAVFDTEPPSIPGHLAANDITDVSFQVNWDASTDNIGVASYEVFLGSDLVATVSDTFAILTGLQPLTTYSVSVRAVDLKGNKSGFSTALQVTTISSSTDPVIYYPSASGDLTVLTTWGTQVGGGGTKPSSFTTNYQHFVIDRNNANINSALTISGTDSRLMLDDNLSLTINANFTGILDVGNSATVYVNSLTSPSFGVLSPTSTIRFSGNPNNVPGANYGNLVLDGTNSNKVFSSGTYTVNGNLDVVNGVTLTGSNGNNTIVNILGNLTLQGDANTPADNQLLSINFIKNGTQSLIATQTDMRFNSIHIADSSSLNLVTGTTPKILTVGSATGGGIAIDNGATLFLGKNKLVIQDAGAVNALGETGNISTSKGEISVNSSGTQISNLYFVPGFDTLKTIQLNANASGQVNVRTKLYVDELVDLTSGRLNSNDLLVLVSTDTHTARVGKIGASGTMLGKVEFQRYLDPKGRAYRYMSAPVFASTVANWSKYLPVTGPFQGSTNASTDNSLYYYDSDNGGWIGYPSATSQEEIELGRGYSIFVFGGATSKKLRILGPIQQGTFTFTNLSADQTPETEDDDVEAGNGWSLLGNPYASPIQWNASGWNSSGLNGTVYVRSNEIINNVLVSTVHVWNGSVGDLPKGIIAQGQSFWVKAAGLATPTLSITEDAKYDTTRTVMQRVATPRNLLAMTLSNGTLSDKSYVHFVSGATEQFDQGHDAYKLVNTYFTLSSKIGTFEAAINSLPETFCQKSIKLNVRNSSAGQYHITFSNLNSFSYDIEAKLIDHFTNTETALTEGTSYTFDITADPLSSGESRFEVLIQKPALDQSTVLGTGSPEFCGDGTATVTIKNSQRGVRYSILNDGETAKTVTGTGSDLAVNIESSLLAEGANLFTMKANFDGCAVTTLASNTTINYIQKPVATIVDNTIVSSYTGKTQWLLDGEEIEGATENSFEPVVSGEYTVLAIGNNCEVSSDPVIFAITGIEQLGENDFVIYPNPVKTRFIVKVPQVKEGSDMVLQIYNALGMVVGEYEVTNRHEGIEINAENFRGGLYTLKISAQRRQFEKRFIRE